MLQLLVSPLACRIVRAMRQSSLRQPRVRCWAWGGLLLVAVVAEPGGPETVPLGIGSF